MICEVEPCTLRAEGMKVIWSMMTSQLETKALPIKVKLTYKGKALGKSGGLWVLGVWLVENRAPVSLFPVLLEII